MRIAIIGTINPQKNQLEAVEAFELLLAKGRKNIALDIIGADGRWKGNKHYAENLREYIQEKHIPNVTIIPPILNLEELKIMRQKYDINLVCSKAEGMGRVTVESMLSGSLTIGANAGATPEILGDGKYGLLYESGNVQDLADKIDYAVNHKKDMKLLALKAQAYAADVYSSENYVSKIIQLYEDIVNSQG